MPLFGPDVVEGVVSAGDGPPAAGVVELPDALHAEFLHHVQRTLVPDVGEGDKFRDAEFRGVRDAGPAASVA